MTLAAVEGAEQAEARLPCRVPGERRSLACWQQELWRGLIELDNVASQCSPIMKELDVMDGLVLHHAAVV